MTVKAPSSDDHYPIGFNVDGYSGITKIIHFLINEHNGK